MVTRYTTFEMLPRTPENLRLLKMGRARLMSHRVSAGDTNGVPRARGRRNPVASYFAEKALA